MLTNLHIENFAIIDTCDLDFQDRMTVVTGETGAGKSIVLDALELVLGARAESSFLSDKKCDIIASFDIKKNKNIQNWLSERNLESDKDCILRRSLTKDGRSKSFINNTPVPLQLLRECGECLITIHGQHEHQSLVQRDAQRDLLDNFGKHDTKTLEALYTQWHDLKNKLNSLNRSDSQIEFLKYQVDEFDKLNLQLSELETIDRDHKNLANADKYSQVYQNLADLLNNTLPLLTKSLSLLNILPPNNLREFFDTAQIQLTEASSELSHKINQIESNPEKLAELEKRLSKIHDMARKHRVKPEELFSLQEKLKSELEDFLKLDETLKKLEEEIKNIKTNYLIQAKKLSESRKKSALKMSKAIEKYMHQLGMPGGKFAIDCIALDENSLTAYGLEKIEFLVSANPGQPLQPLSKVASGGELSRISLAIQLIAAETTDLPALVFDEVDVGIGGATAAIVGQLLRQLGHNAQIICVTHLPQVAALGEHHLKVHKTLSKNKTQTQINYLNNDERVQEVARMLGGLKMTEKTLLHAKELITGEV